MTELLKPLTVAAAILIGLVDGGALPPKPSTVLPVKVVEVYDGDTVTVEYTLRARVRLIDCWAPEVRTKDDAEKLRGYESADHLRRLTLGKKALLTVPLNGARLDGVFTFGRVLGRLNVDGRDMSRAQVAAGHATETKSR